MLRKILGPGLSLILFAAAVWLLHNELKVYHLGDIRRAFDAIPGAHLWSAAGLTILSYAVMTGYDVLAMRYIRKTAISIRGWNIPLPSVNLLLCQLIIAALDWMLASLVLFVLLAPGTAMSYPEFLAVFLLAQLAGLVSQVPGGLGVFEMVIVLMLSARLPANPIFGEHFYNFQGLRQYKDKFDPEWRPKYLASPGGLALPQIFAGLATLISGGIKGVVAK
jgi:uncharacterized membrane protein YbhN (UPF0104 family)